MLWILNKYLLKISSRMPLLFSLPSFLPCAHSFPWTIFKFCFFIHFPRLISSMVFSVKIFSFPAFSLSSQLSGYKLSFKPVYYFICFVIIIQSQCGCVLFNDSYLWDGLYFFLLKYLFHMKNISVKITKKNHYAEEKFNLEKCSV